MRKTCASVLAVALAATGGYYAATYDGDPEASAVQRARSPGWPRVERAYKAGHPACEACGCGDDLQVHHVEPFHLFPERELDPTNLIALCGPGGHSCHLVVGHGGNYRCYNPRVRECAAEIRRGVRERLCERR